MFFILFISFLVTAIFGRIILQYILTGDHGVRVAKKNSTLVSKVSHILLFSSFAAFLLLSILDLKGILTPQIQLTSSWFYFGLTLATVAIILTFLSQVQMKESWRIGVNESEKTDLVTKGFYKYIRNPIYLFGMIFFVGLFFIFPHTLYLMSMVLAYISIDLQVRYVEEPYLEKIHGDLFLKYKKSVPRFIPFC